MSGKMETHIGTQDTPVGSSASAEEERTSNLRRHGLTKRRLEEEEDLDQLQNRVYDASLLELRQAFATCDRDGTGYISQEELGDSLRSIGIKMDGDELEYLYKRLDKNGDGKVGFEEFLRVLADECEEAELEAELHEMQSFFAMADKDGSGRLSVAEVRDSLGFVCYPKLNRRVL